MKNPYSRKNVLTGLVVYASGDTIAAVCLGEFAWARVLVVALVGGFLYALEVPLVFAWIDRRVTTTRPLTRNALRTLLAVAYFNPLWIARHLFFLRAATGRWDDVSLDLLRVGAVSWLLNVPIAVAGNWIIQSSIPLRWRFLGSATFSGMMAVFYAVTGTLLAR